MPNLRAALVFMPPPSTHPHYHRQHAQVVAPPHPPPPTPCQTLVIAALNMEWPGEKLTVHILDDSSRPEVAKMCRRLAFQTK